jgi:hypothetical protein
MARRTTSGQLRTERASTMRWEMELRGVVETTEAIRIAVLPLALSGSIGSLGARCNRMSVITMSSSTPSPPTTLSKTSSYAQVQLLRQRSQTCPSRLCTSMHQVSRNKLPIQCIFTNTLPSQLTRACRMQPQLDISKRRYCLLG